jgi:hypothetical protein
MVVVLGKKRKTAMAPWTAALLDFFGVHRRRRS